MIKKILVILAMLGVMIPAFALAQTDSTYGLKGASQGTKLINAGSSVSSNAVPNLIGQIIGIALSFVGAIFFILILYAGFLWMTAFGSSEKVDSAKDILLHAAIGLVIVLAAYAISTFVFSALAGTGGSTTAQTNTSNTSASCASANVNTCASIVDNNGQALCSWDGTNNVCSPL